MFESSGEYAIQVRSLTRTYAGLKAVDQLSFSVCPGVICGFVGPNGAGKTTTMRILATLLKPDGGSAEVFGLDTQNVIDAKQVRHMIGFMPDYFGLYDDMTAGEYLDFFAATYRIPSVQRRVLVKDILEIIGLPEKKDSLIAGLSRGMQQRLSLGRCLVHSPKLLLLDEPASGLDPRARIELMELLRELKNMGKTILISSHILSELHNLCDTVIIIENGGLIFSGTLQEASSMLRGGRQFMELVFATGELHGIRESLETIQGLQNLRVQGKVVFVEFNSPLTRVELIRFCVEKKLPLEEARCGEARLEEIFMNLTKGS